MGVAAGGFRSGLGGEMRILTWNMRWLGQQESCGS